MLSNRRLARLEASLSPRQATLVWLAEAQRFGSLAAYAASLVDQPVGMLPLVAVPQQARRAVRGTLRGQPRNLIAEREQEAFHEAPFLVQLVIELDRATRTTLRRAELRWMALWSDWRAHQSHAEAPGEPTGASRRALDDLWIMFSNAQHARTLLEHRYLAGRGALFPDTLADWQDLCAGVQLLAGVPTTPVCRCQRHTPGSGAGGLDRRDHVPSTGLALVGETGAVARRIQGSSSASSSLQPPTSPVGTFEIGTRQRRPEPHSTARAAEPGLSRRRAKRP